MESTNLYALASLMLALTACTAAMNDERALSVVRGCEGKEYCFIEQAGKTISLVSTKIDNNLLCAKKGVLEIAKKEKTKMIIFII